MKKIKNVVIMIFVFVFVIIGGKSVSAQTYQGKLYDVYHPNSGFSVFAEESNGLMDYNSWMIKSSIDNRIYYCIDPAVALGEVPSGSFHYITGEGNIVGKANLTKVKYQKILLLAYYGYGYKDSNVNHTSKKWYGITQVMIWRVMRPDLTWTFKSSRNATPSSSLYANEILEIEKLVNNHDEVASFKNKIIKLRLGESITLSDTHKVFSNFIRKTNPKYVSMKENGNSLTITGESLGNESIQYSKKAFTTGSFALLTSPTYQNLVAVGKPSLPSFQIQVEVTGGTLNLQKIDDTTGKAIAQGDATLKGAVYEIYDVNNKAVGKIITDSYGKGKLSLDYGKYTVKEIKAPLGYHLSDNIYEFEITRENPNISLEVSDKVITGKALLTKKKGGAGEKFIVEAGATFDIIDANGKVVDKLVTDKKGIASIILPYGIYTVHQTDGSAGYVFADDFKIEIKENKLYEFDVENIKLSKLVFTKSDIATGEKLPDTLIEIYKVDDTLVYSGKTDNNGNVEISNLEIGKYYILEKEAPKYYLVNDEKIYFEVKENGQIIKANMKDIRKRGSLEFFKTDASGSKFLSDALIEVYFKETGKLVYQGTTDKNGKVVLSDLAAGEYCIYEKKAPSGYQLLTDAICFEIKEDKEVVKVTMKNEEKTKIPDTMLSDFSNIFGILLVMVVLSYFVYDFKKNC